jgi:hypothetical protein
MSIATLVLGDRKVLTVTLYDENNNLVVVDEADDVQVSINRIDGSEILVGPIEADPDFLGANWALGVVKVQLEAEDTADLTVSKLDVEVQVTSASGEDQHTYFADLPMNARKGLIP